MTRRPNFFVVGAPKSGTTALFEYLERHPDVFVPIEKEPHYFAPDRFEHTGRTYSEAEYLAMFAGARDQKRVGEASTLYLSSEVAPAAIHAFDPRAKIVACVRNPLETVWGLHLQTVYNGRFVVGDPTLPLAAARYEFIGRYATQLERWFARFGREGVHVVVFDDFKRDARREYARVLEFLELGAEHVPELPVVNEYKELRLRSLKTLADRAPRPVSALVRALPRPIYRGLMRRVERLYSRPAKRPAMPDELREHLRASLRPEIERLSALLERDLSAWLSPPRPGGA